MCSEEPVFGEREREREEDVEKGAELLLEIC